MPNWQPNWEDVQFDHAKAQAAIDECNAAASALDTGLTGLSTAQSTLDHDGSWQGRYRDDFGRAVPGLQGDATSTRDELRQLAGAITGAASEARAEQSARVADRQRWRAEKAREDAARGPGGRRIPD
jgi:hypothetical protein